jgi:hypothetical protein
MCVLMQGLGVKYHWHPAFALLPLVLMPQQILVGNDIGPVMATGVVYAKQNLTEARQTGERFKNLCGQ